MEKKTTAHYENNPFYIGLSGLQLLFRNAQQVGIYAAILAGMAIIFGTIANGIDTINQLNHPEHSYNYSQNIALASPDLAGVNLLAVGIVLLISVAVIVVIMAISLLLYGVLEYTAARLAIGEKVELKQAFRAVLKNLLGYLWLYIVMIVKLFLWTLLLIVPGIIMSVRYSLAGTVFFAEGKRGNAAIKRSADLTKGAWFTTFAGFGLWNLITFNQITPLVNPSASAILYRQLKDVTDKGHKKPNAHWLSWLTFFGPIVLMTIFISFVVLLAITLWLTVVK